MNLNFEIESILQKTDYHDLVKSSEWKVRDDYIKLWLEYVTRVCDFENVFEFLLKTVKARTTKVFLKYS